MTRLRNQLYTIVLGTFCLITGVMAQGYDAGRAAYIKGDYKAALQILRPMAEAGDAQAQKMMGIMYDSGFTPPSNLFFLDTLLPEEKKQLIELKHISQDMIKNRLQNKNISEEERDLLETFL